MQIIHSHNDCPECGAINSRHHYKDCSLNPRPKPRANTVDMTLDFGLIIVFKGGAACYGPFCTLSECEEYVAKVCSQKSAVPYTKDDFEFVPWSKYIY